MSRLIATLESCLGPDRRTMFAEDREAQTSGWSVIANDNDERTSRLFLANQL
jgi:hypothetical protein